MENFPSPPGRPFIGERELRFRISEALRRDLDHFARLCRVSSADVARMAIEQFMAAPINTDEMAMLVGIGNTKKENTDGTR